MKLDPLHAGESCMLCLVIAWSGLGVGMEGDLLGASPSHPTPPARTLESVCLGFILPGDFLGLTFAQM